MMRRIVLVAAGMALVAVLAGALLLTREPKRVRQDLHAEFLVQPREIVRTFAPGDVLPGDVILCKDDRLRMVVPQPGFSQVIEAEASVTTSLDGSVTAQCPPGPFTRSL